MADLVKEWKRAVHEPIVKRLLGTIDEQQREIDELRRQALMLVQAAGGCVVVHKDIIRRFDNPTWTVEDDPANDCVRFKVTV